MKKKAVTAADALRYAMSLPVATTVSGIDSMRVLRQNLQDRRAASRRCRTRADGPAPRTASPPIAADGRFELYKTTAKHEGDEGREAARLPAAGRAGGPSVPCRPLARELLGSDRR